MNSKTFFFKKLPESSDPIGLIGEIVDNTDPRIHNQKDIFWHLKHAQYTRNNKFHTENLLKHLIDCYINCMDYSLDPIFSMSGLFHDIGKVSTAKFDKDKQDWTFYRHEYVGAKIVRSWMEQEGFGWGTTDRVCKAIAHSGFRIFDNTSDRAIRRWLRAIGPMTWRDIRILRLCDRMANKSNTNKPIIYKKYIEIDNRINKIAEKVF